eukprot:6208286-Pleurochrysis_carterae.AAC.1
MRHADSCMHEAAKHEVRRRASWTHLSTADGGSTCSSAQHTAALQYRMIQLKQMGRTTRARRERSLAATF